MALIKGYRPLNCRYAEPQDTPSWREKMGFYPMKDTRFGKHHRGAIHGKGAPLYLIEASGNAGLYQKCLGKVQYSMIEKNIT